ncbi:hypothetical protein EGJ00_10000 [Pseudomonas saudiphocaensis]|nr:hypothetical protein EGJ00_10000 [Pseudomonas saudiphocaensis]
MPVKLLIQPRRVDVVFYIHRDSARWLATPRKNRDLRRNHSRAWPAPTGEVRWYAHGGADRLLWEQAMPVKLPALIQAAHTL